MTAVVTSLPPSLPTVSQSHSRTSSSSTRPSSLIMDSRQSALQAAAAIDYRPVSTLSRSAAPFTPAAASASASAKQQARSNVDQQHTQRPQRHLRRASSDHDLDRPHLGYRSMSGSRGGNDIVVQDPATSSSSSSHGIEPNQNPWTTPMPVQAFYHFSPTIQPHVSSFDSHQAFNASSSPPPSNHFHYPQLGDGVRPKMSSAQAHAHAQVQANFAAWATAYQGMMMAATHQQQQNIEQHRRSSAPQSKSTPSPSLSSSYGQSSRSSSTTAGKSSATTSSSVTASSAPFHPYRRGAPSHRDVSVSSVASSATSSARSMSFTAGGPKPVVGLQDDTAREELKVVDVDDQTEVLRSPPRHPADAVRNASRESVASHSSTTPGESVISRGRPRLNSTSSQTSVNGTTTRPGRVPVPPYIGTSVLPSAKESRAASSPGHSRQSSSMSSAGTVIKPTLSTTPSSASTITQASPSPSHHIANVDGGAPSTPTKQWKPSALSQTQSAVVLSPERAPRSSVSVPPTPEETASKLADKGPKTGGGLKGRLQRALKKDNDKDHYDKRTTSSSVNPPIRSEVTHAPASPALPQVSPKANLPSSASMPAIQAGGQPPYSSNASETSTASSVMPVTPPNATPPSHGLGNRRPSNSSFAPSLIEPLDGKAKGKGRSLFNLRNASTDNISISSTVSSASMMIRKMGSLGKLARRNSLAGISRIFKDKSKDSEDGVLAEEPASGETSNKRSKKDKKRGIFSSKTGPAASSTSHATASGDDRAVGGLSPAAQLARQHTLRSKAEEKVRQEGSPAQVSPEAEEGQRESDRFSWNTDLTARPGGEDAAALPPLGSNIPAGAFASTVNAYSRPDSPRSDSFDVEHELDDSEDDDEYEGHSGTVEDVTLRMGDASFYDEPRSSSEEDGYMWGQTYRDKHAVPAKGILKATSSFSSDIHFQAPSTPWTRSRSNSADNASAFQEPGPLAKLPAQDPNNLDGLKQEKHASTYDPFSPSFSPFDSTSPQSEREPLAERVHFPYANASLNTSAPALSNFAGKPSKPTRAATSPLRTRKNLIWAPECAVYHTFHPSEYDRRSEPATCNRLTPQLAQQIKDELNGYKMEEMDVHPSSRIHTHFFV